MNNYLFKMLSKIKYPCYALLKKVYQITRYFRKRISGIQYQEALHKVNELQPKPIGSALWNLPDNKII